MILMHGANSVNIVAGGAVIIGGRTYKTVIMPDGHEWLAENLDYKFDVDGSPITLNIQGTIPNYPAAWYYNRNEASYGIDGTYKCGLMYNGHAAGYLETNKENLLPSGWHIPTRTEWSALASAIGSMTAGTKLKSIDNSIISGFPNGWNGSDDYEFNALPAGLQQDDTSQWFNTGVLFWTSSPNTSFYRYSRLLKNDSAIIGDDFTSNGTGLYIRLMKS